MYLYIDKENVASLIENRGHKLYNDCIKTIQNHLDVYFNFSKEELKSSEALINWFQLLTDGAGNGTQKFVNENIFPDRPIKENCHVAFSYNKLTAIYLISDENIHFLKNVGAVIVGSPGEEIEIFNKLFLLQNDYDFHKEIEIGGNELTKWADLKKYSLPLTDIVFLDSYILSDNSLIESNFIAYLKILCSNSANKVNVVLYVNSSNLHIDYETCRKLVVDALKSVTGYSPNFTLVKYNQQRGLTNLGEHDRTILTNYNRLKSGDTFNYFLSNGNKLTQGRELSYLSLAKRDNHKLAIKLKEDMQMKIDALKNGVDSITGDKKSNFLNFS